MEPDIAPLAKRLAEENNVDWRHLKGTGAGGRIVERDILEYLARVMAGEEDVNPTPEPLPEGMDAWPEADVAGYRAQSQPSTKATLEDELITIDDELLLDPPPQRPAPSNAEPARDEIDEDIFLFDDPEPKGTAAPSDEMPTLERQPRLDIGSAPAPEGVTFTGGALDDDSDLFAFDAPTAAEAGAPSSDDTPLWQDVESPQRDLHSDEQAEADRLEQGPPISAQAAEADSADHDRHDLEAPSATAVKHEVSDAVVHTPSPVSDAPPPPPTPPATAALAATPTAATPMPQSSSKIASLPAMTYGALLRRRAELSALVQAQLAISHEFGGQISPTSFLLRAAAKGLRRVPLGDAGQLGLAVFSGDGIAIKHLPDADHLPFRALLEQLNDPQALPELAAEQAALIVADLSDLDVDEAFLNVGAPVLTLGRILVDSSSGAHYSTLSLSGDIKVERGSRYLATVNELLNSPIRLVV